MSNLYDILSTHSLQHVLSVASFQAVQEALEESAPESVPSSLTIPSSPQAKVAPTLQCAA